MMHANFIFDRPNRSRRPGIVAGVAVSVLLHAVVLFGYRLSSPPPADEPKRTMTVWLRPITPPKPPQPVIANVAPPMPPPRKREREPVPVRERPALATAQPAQQQPAEDKPVETQAITVPREQDPLYADQQPKQFNMDEALKTARAVAKEKAKPGTLTAQLENHPLYPEDNQTKLQKGVAGAKKYDCLQAGAGAGLLAPLVWAFDKHCKF